MAGVSGAGRWRRWRGSRVGSPAGSQDCRDDPLGARERIAAVVILRRLRRLVSRERAGAGNLPDGLTYHLGLPFEYIRLGGFPSPHRPSTTPCRRAWRCSTPWRSPSGATRRPSWWSSRFLLATPPLILRIGRRLGMQRSGVAGGSGVLLLRAGGGRHRVVLVHRCGPGLLHPGGVLPAAGVARYRGTRCTWRRPAWRRDSAMPSSCRASIAVAAAGALRDWRSAAAVARAAAAGRGRGTGGMAPWLARNWVLTGNPAGAARPTPCFRILTFTC